MRNRYKYIFCLIILVLLFGNLALSNIAGESSIRNIAQNFLDYRQFKPRHTLEIQSAYTISGIEQLRNSSDNTVIAYIIKVKPKGFLIISPNLDEKSVIAYSFCNNWDSGITKDNFLYQLLTLDLNLRKNKFSKLNSQTYPSKNLEWQYISNSGSTRLQWPEEGSTETGGWIETTWRQLLPYNKFCPWDSVRNKRSVVGCVATAMAQIINYHKRLPFDNFDEEDSYYTRSGFNIDRDSDKYDFPNFATLNTYLDTIRAKYERGVELDSTDIAALCFACGVAVGMNYTADSSYPDFSSDVETAFMNDLKYNNAEYLRYPENKDYEFDEILINNIINGLPGIVILVDHAIIVDGYNAEGDFHLNWGWGDTNPDSISTVWTNVFHNWTYHDEGIQAGILNIRKFPLQFNLQLQSTDQLELGDSYLNEEGGHRPIDILNSGVHPIYIEHIIKSENVGAIYPDAPNFDETPITLNPDQETKALISHIPYDIGPIDYGKLQIFGNYHINKYRTNFYMDIDVYGYGLPGTVINRDTVSGVWNKESSPYMIRRNISINEGKKLIIEAGTKIKFESSYEFKIDQNDQLVAKGMENDPIYITAENPNKGWQGLVFYESASDDTLEYCVISHANRTRIPPVDRGGGISIIKSSPFITHSIINNNQSELGGGGIYLQNSSSYIINTRLENNLAKMAGGALSITGGSSPTLSNVTISHNYAKGNGGGIYIDRSSSVNFEIRDRCNIFQNHSDREIGNDLYSDNSNSVISVVLDTFTVLNPDSIHAYPRNYFTFTINSDPSIILIDNPEIPTEFIIGQNYPNPFNPTTVISWQLAVGSYVDLSVYNLLGQKVATLVLGKMPAGYHEVEFNGQNLSSGIYIYKIEAGTWQDVKKMVLLK